MAVALLINFGRVRNERENVRFGQLARKNFESRQEHSFFGRMDRSLRNEPPAIRIKFHSTKGVGDDAPFDWLRRMTRPPAHDVAAQTLLRKNIPDRFACA